MCELHVYVQMCEYVSRMCMFNMYLRAGRVIGICMYRRVCNCWIYESIVYVKMCQCVSPMCMYNV